MMLYKVHGQGSFGDHVIAKSKLSQFERVGLEYQSASGPGFSARKRGDFREVRLGTPLSELPQSAIQYAVIGANNFSFGGANLSTKFKKEKL